MSIPGAAKNIFRPKPQHTPTPTPTPTPTITKQAQRGLQGLPGERYRTTTTSDVLHEIWINNMLSRPSTQILNMFSNATQPFLNISDTAGRALLSTFSKPEDKTYYAEVVGGAYGFMHGIMKALQFQGSMLKSKLPGQFDEAEVLAQKMGISPGILASSKLEHTQRALSSESMNIDPESLVGRVADGIGALVNLPVNALNSADIAYKVITDDMYKHQWAAKQVAQGKFTNARDAYAAALADPNVSKGAVAAAEYATFTNRPEIPFFSWITDTAAEKLPGMRWIIPFKRTIANLAEQSIERSPLALLSGTKRSALFSSNPAERIDAQAKQLTGMAILTTLAYTLGDYITGEPPQGAIQREQWQKLHGNPLSLQFGADQKSIRLDNLGVMGQLLKSVAMYRQRIDSMSDEELAIWSDPESITNFVKENTMRELMEELSQWTAPIVDMISDVTWAESIVGLYRAYEQSQRNDDYTPVYMYFEDIAARTMPFFGSGAWHDVLNRRDPTVYEKRNPGDSFKYQDAWMRENLWKRYDELGHALVPQILRGPGQTHPSAPYNPNHYLYKKMEELGLEPSARSKYISMPGVQGGKGGQTIREGSEVKLSRDEWDDLHSIVREGLWVDQKDFQGRPIVKDGEPVKRQAIPSYEEFIESKFKAYNLDGATPGIQRMLFTRMRDKYNAQLREYMRFGHPTFSLKAQEAMMRDAELAKIEAAESREGIKAMNRLGGNEQ